MNVVAQATTNIKENTNFVVVYNDSQWIKNKKKKYILWLLGLKSRDGFPNNRLIKVSNYGEAHVHPSVITHITLYNNYCRTILNKVNNSELYKKKNYFKLHILFTRVFYSRRQLRLNLLCISQTGRSPLY